MKREEIVANLCLKMRYKEYARSSVSRGHDYPVFRTFAETDEIRYSDIAPEDIVYFKDGGSTLDIRMPKPDGIDMSNVKKEFIRFDLSLLETGKTPEHW